METRFVLAVTVATAFHAFVLLGVNRPHVPTHRPSPAAHLPECPPPFAVDLEPPKDSEDEPRIAEAPPKGQPEEFKPTLDEPVLSPSNDEQMMPPRTPQPATIVTRISFDPPGVPDGTSDKWNDVKIWTPDGLDNSPRTKAQIAPSYPAAERSAGITGEVLVEFIVDESGHVQHAHVVRSTAAAFESPTIRAVERWRFEPGKKNGRAVRFRMVVPVSFNLEA